VRLMGVRHKRHHRLAVGCNRWEWQPLEVVVVVVTEIFLWKWWSSEVVGGSSRRGDHYRRHLDDTSSDHFRRPLPLPLPTTTNFNNDRSQHHYNDPTTTSSDDHSVDLPCRPLPTTTFRTTGTSTTNHYEEYSALSGAVLTT
jgi:hypothetical protein